MGFFSRIEEACAAFIERAFAKTFPTDLEPAQIARKLVTTMEARTGMRDGGPSAPGRYVVRVNPDDFARLSPHQAYLEREWSELVCEMAARVNVTLRGEGVQLRSDSGVVQGAVEIDPAAGLQLRMLRGLPSGAVYPLLGSATVGRDDGNDIVVIDPSVSRRHARVELDTNGVTVRDLKSTNGTFINGERINAQIARPGDVVRFGKTDMLLEDSGA